MSKPLFSSLIEPFDEWVLVRVASTSSTVLIPVMRDGKVIDAQKKVLRENKGIVVAVGPGRRSEEGVLVPIDPRITPGATVVFAGKTAFRPPDMEQEMAEEGLYFLAASTLVCRLRSRTGVAVPVGA